MSASFIFAQKFTISGYAKDKATGENLIGANVYVKEIAKGTTTNKYGFYSLTLDKGEYTFIVSFIGYKDYNQKLSLNKNIAINISLEEQTVLTNEVVVSAERSDKNIQGAEMGTVKLPVEKIKSLPAFLGEVDILKTIQLLPGVQSAGEGNSGFYVRGGGPDQNLIILDEAVVYNAAHLFGFFSVFNADVIKDVNLIKGGMPANYGGRLSSVVDISMKDGNNQKYQVEGGIGLISSRIAAQGPIKKDTASFIFSARRTYIDILMKPFMGEFEKTKKLKGSGYYFYDLNAKLNYRFSDKDRLYLSGYYGRDVFSFKNPKATFLVSIPWGNATTSIRWNHLFSDKLFMNTTAIFSDYQFEFHAEQSSFEFKLFSGIRDYNGKIDFSYMPTIRHNIGFGANYTFHTFIPSSVSARIGGTTFDTGKIKKLFANEGAIYVMDDFDLTEKFKIIGGLRATLFQHIGPFERYEKDAFGNPVDTTPYSAGKIIAQYQHIEPRLAVRYSINMKSSVKVSYTQNYQYIHLASLSSVSLPTDLWIPSTSLIKPQFATQYAVGYFRNFFNNSWESSVELYYKEMKNQIDYKDGATPEDGLNDNVDYSFTFGTGKSYGLELFIKKRIGKITGWIGYTLSKTTRLFPEINNGLEYPAKYDRRHDLSTIATYELNNKWTFSAVFVFATGNALTLPIGRYLIDGRPINQYGERNSYRMAPYHRMDISATYIHKKTEKFESSWNFSIYNVYCRYNPYFIYFEDEGDLQFLTSNPKAKQVSLFPILPSVVWNFKF
ncbi:MAG: TonB-dependent receptor [Bacteroidia bacterium]|nr:TonB-dependent receptor [Bacteroidia bacterium]